MSAQNAEPSLKPPPKMSGMRTVLQYTGIPPSWLDKRPKLPSRNWLIFLSVTSTILGYGVYDRRECRRIQQEYIEKVQELSEGPLQPLEENRKVTVYGAKWPGDEDHQQALKYFRKYVKPILVAAAVDFDMYSGKYLGDITKRVAEDIRLRRRLEAGIDDDSEHKKLLPTYKPLSERKRAELEGGTVLIGRPTLKEYMAGLKQGWTNGLEKVEPEDVLAREFDEDHHFDEVDDDLPTQPEKPSYSPIFTMTSQAMQQKRTTSADTTGSDVPPPSTIPQLPPILLVPFSNRIGFTQIPLMIWDWFNKRHLVQSGSEAAYRLVLANTRPINVPEQPTTEFVDAETSSEPQGGITPPRQEMGDLDFDLSSEAVIKKSLNKLPAEVEESRRKYYEKLPERLATARALSRGTREPTKDEIANPPPTEVELRAERMKKELAWRRDVVGWNTVKPGAPVTWDERFREAIRIFIDPSEQ
ncbi:hypothetical protein D9611_004834 [Ephemerocybe angulata]|uniref:Mitochondrial import inner membrane translocase subunit TIM54 n=1 Tax=Ephemerocybe angulata TaxID=980116 RepID=A0A8H5B3W3_9AGAR|nr:hypothetical protein D9611_004834 [Tulosesus angulatus]